MNELVETLNAEITELKRALDTLSKRHAEVIFERDQIADRRAALLQKIPSNASKITTNRRYR